MRILRSVGVVCVMALPSCDVVDPDTEGATRLTWLIPDDRVAEIGTRLPLSVRAIGERDEPVAGATLLWEVVAGDGSVEPATSRTGQDGVASAELIVGPAENRVMARVQGREVSTRVNWAHGCSPCGEWRFASVADGGRAWASATVVAGGIWLIGGETGQYSRDSVDVFDVMTATWSQGVVRLPQPLSASVAAAIDGKTYVIGGTQLLDFGYNLGGSALVYAFDHGTGAWVDRSPLQVGRFFAAGAVLGGRIHVVGGYTYCEYFGWCSRGPTSGHEIYDPALDRWIAGPPMKTPRAMAGAAVLDGKLYVVGGTSDDSFWMGSLLAEMEMYDPLTGQWVHKAALPIAEPFQLAAMNGELYALESAARDGRRSRLYSYDPSSDMWTRLRDAPTGLLGSVLAPVDGRLYAIGGYTNVTDNPYSRPISNAVYVLHR
jgi:hypothetical protein